MNDHRLSTKAPRPGIGPRPSKSPRRITSRSSYPTFIEGLDRAYQKYVSFAETIAREEPLAPVYWDSIYQSEVEKRLAHTFGAPRPRMVEASTTPIKWSDVLHASLTPTDFQRQPSGMYRCRVRGRLIDISEANYIEILTGVTERLVQPVQGLSDEQKEQKVLLKLGSDLHKAHATLLRCMSGYAFRVLAQTNVSRNQSSLLCAEVWRT
jgi:hypothetical protein